MQHMSYMRGIGKLTNLHLRISIAAPAGCECIIGAVRLLLYCIILYTAVCVPI